MKKLISIVLTIMFVFPLLFQSFSVSANEERYFTIDELGTITGYSGNTANLVIPETINGITVKAIGEMAFWQHDNIWVNLDETTNFLRTVSLPDTCKTIENDAFFGCAYLTDVYSNNIECVGTTAFGECYALKSFNFSKVKTVDENAFCSTSLESVVSDSIVSIGTNSFAYCDKLKEVNLNNVSEIGYRAFNNSNNIEYVYAPKLAGAIGASIRLTDNGLRFGFTWNNTTNMQERGTKDLEYGFIYAYGETDDLTILNGTKKVASKKVVNGDKTSFNLVFTGIPRANFDTKISARAYVLIDGIYFYSDILTRSFRGVANAVLNDPSVSSNIKTQLIKLLEA